MFLRNLSELLGRQPSVLTFTDCRTFFRGGGKGLPLCQIWVCAFLKRRVRSRRRSLQKGSHNKELRKQIGAVVSGPLGFSHGPGRQISG